MKNEFGYFLIKMCSIFLLINGVHCMPKKSNYFLNYLPIKVNSENITNDFGLIAADMEFSLTSINSDQREGKANSFLWLKTDLTKRLY